MNLRITKQKNLIEEEIKKLTTFFNADNLHSQVIKKNKKIGIATVYRFLKNLTSEGKIHSYSCNRKTIYSSNQKNHCHFICEKCGEKTHLNIKEMDFIQESIKGEVCHFQLDITGICEKCRNK